MGKGQSKVPNGDAHGDATSYVVKGVTYGVPVTNPPTFISSLFGEIAAGRMNPSGTGPRGQKLLYSDPACVIFSARGGESGTHLLVVPKRHVQDWTALVREGAGSGSAALSELRGRALLEHMEEAGRKYVSAAGPDEVFHVAIENLQMGFHR